MSYCRNCDNTPKIRITVHILDGDSIGLFVEINVSEPQNTSQQREDTGLLTSGDTHDVHGLLSYEKNLEPNFEKKIQAKAGFLSIVLTRTSWKSETSSMPWTLRDWPMLV